MIRFICFLLGKEFEPCKGCEVLRMQLEIANNERAQLLNTMLGLVKPEVIQSPTIPVKPFIRNNVSWAMRQKALEEKDREEMRIRKDLEIQNAELEKELGVNNASEVS